MRSSRILFAAACLALCALATSANAATILQYGQTNNSDTGFTETLSGTTTTLTAGPTLAGPNTVPVTVTAVGNVVGLNQLAFETFNLTSTQAPSGTSQGGFSGTLSITQLPPPAPPGPVLFLTATITNGILTQDTTNNTVNFNASAVFTNLNPAIIAQNGGATTLTGNFSFTSTSFTGSVAGRNAAGQQNGNFSGAVPEPASLVSGGLAALAGLGCFGWRRFKASRV